MDYIQAKNKILSLWKEGGHAYGKVKKEEYKQMYYAILSHMKGGNAEWQDAVGMFFLHGAIAFDRYVEPRPSYVDDEMYDMFCHFLNALQNLDGKHLERTAFLHLEKAQWDIYRECSLFLYGEEMKVFLCECEEKVKSISLTGDNKTVIQNIETKKEEILGLIDNIRSGAIKTNIHTELPYQLTATNASIKLEIEGVLIEVCITNHSKGSSIPMVNVAECSTMTTSGASKWTTSYCELDIAAHCLIDGLEECNRVTFKDDEANEGYWTAIFDFTYNTIKGIWDYLLQHNELKGTWPPLPNDIHYLEYHVCAGEKEYDFELSTNPSLIYRFTSLNKPSQTYDIGVKEDTRWSGYAYMLSKIYAETGQFKETIFWLNVSTEALVEEFVSHHFSVRSYKI